MKMSRAARNRVSRNLRDQTPRGTVPVRVVANSPHDLNHQTSIRCVGYLGHNQTSIRCVGYLGLNQTSVRYAGSGDAGYRSEWSGKTDIFTDHRWDQTVSNRAC